MIKKYAAALLKESSKQVCRNIFKVLIQFLINLLKQYTYAVLSDLNLARKKEEKGA